MHPVKGMVEKCHIAWILLALLALTFGSVAVAQYTTASLGGTVTDALRRARAGRQGCASGTSKPDLR